MSDFRSGFAWGNAGAYTLKLRHTGSENVGGGQGAMVTTDVSCTVATNQDQTIFQKKDDEMIITRTGDAANSEYGYDLSCTLTRHDYKGGVFMSDGYIVRRLMPIECERLQGFPDNWTRIEWKGKPEEECPDTKRYQCCGNSMAVPVMQWIGEGIQMIEDGDL